MSMVTATLCLFAGSPSGHGVELKDEIPSSPPYAASGIRTCAGKPRRITSRAIMLEIVLMVKVAQVDTAVVVFAVVVPVKQL